MNKIKLTVSWPLLLGLGIMILFLGCYGCQGEDGKSMAMNLTISDADNDGIADEVDICPFDPDNDLDGDSVCGDIDHCPGFDDNLDIDNDSIPDGCDPEQILFSLDEYDGLWGYGYPGVASVRFDLPIKTSSSLRGGGTLGFFTFKLPQVGWTNVNQVRIELLKTQLFPPGDVQIKVWSALDQDYEYWVNCGCGQIGMSPPTYGCTPEGCGFPEDDPSTAMIPHGYLMTLTLQADTVDPDWYVLDDPALLTLLQENFQGKNYFTASIGLQPYTPGSIETNITVENPTLEVYQ